MGACWDNSVVECFFGSLKHDRLFKTLAHMKQNVVAYMK
jgi:putative transposase